VRFLLGEMTDADRADVAAWLARQETELGALATKRPRRVHESDSVVVLDTGFKPGAVEVPVRLTVYKDFGRVRIEATTPGYAPDVADRVAHWVLGQLELRIVGQADGRGEELVRAASPPNRNGSVDIGARDGDFDFPDPPSPAR
jgi:hypothetical protein